MQNEIWFRPLIWMDYRLALLFTVAIPIILLLWAVVQKADAIQRLLIIYWRVSSLVAITIYLLIAQIPVGFVAGFIARILIPISLWFWVDLNEEIEDQPTSALKLTFNSWRWAMTLYCLIGAIAQIPSLGCAFSAGAIAQPFCQTWIELPLIFKDYFHPNTSTQFLGFIAYAALIFYIVCLGYFVFFRLGKQGRFATRQ